MRIVLTGLLAAVLTWVAGVEIANAAPLAGRWSGGGTVTLNNGQKEPIRCRISYRPAGKTVEVTATCSHAGGTTHQTGRVIQRSKNRYTGHFRNQQYAVSGNVTVSVRGSRQTVIAISSQGRIHLSLSKR